MSNRKFCDLNTITRKSFLTFGEKKVAGAVVVASEPIPVLIQLV